MIATIARIALLGAMAASLSACLLISVERPDGEDKPHTSHTSAVHTAA